MSNNEWLTLRDAAKLIEPKANNEETVQEYTQRMQVARGYIAVAINRKQIETRNGSPDGDIISRQSLLEWNEARQRRKTTTINLDVNLRDKFQERVGREDMLSQFVNDCLEMYLEGNLEWGNA